MFSTTEEPKSYEFFCHPCQVQLHEALKKAEISIHHLIIFG